MPLITWEEDFSVGVKEIDQQHQKMIEILNNLYNLVSANDFSDQKIGEILKELVDYADYHFSTEEKYFKQFEYEKTVEHIQIHDDYRKRVAEMKEQYESGQHNNILSDLSVFLNSWWIWHINNTDKDYTQSFHDHGLY
jgi:hemerythrin